MVAMLDELLAQGAAVIQWDLRLTVAAAILSTFFLTQIVTSVRSNVALRRSGDGKTPPIMPYAVPVLGNLLAFAFDTKSLLGNIVYECASKLC